MRNRLTKLCIVSHVIHYRSAGQLYAYGPYAREVNVWANLFPEVIIAAPYRETTPAGDTEPLSSSNIRIVPQLETGGDNLDAKLKQLVLLPVILWRLCRALSQADAIHVRCPGNLGLLGILLAPLFSNYRIAKYAGQWEDYPGEGFTVRLQRTLLRSRWWNAPVTVYGYYPNQPPHVIPFFTSVLTKQQLQRARLSVTEKLAQQTAGESAPHVLYVGRLTADKNVDVLIEALGKLRDKGFPLSCDIVGAGPEESKLLTLAAKLGLLGQVSFKGGVEYERVLDFYERSDVLVLASETEGWPKAIAEAMAFGLICIGSERGLVTWMLGGGRGFVVPPGDAATLAEVLGEIAAAPHAYQEMRRLAAEWSQNYSLEELEKALRKLLSDNWQMLPESFCSTDYLQSEPH